MSTAEQATHRADIPAQPQGQEMPRYISHKTVHALKIKAIRFFTQKEADPNDDECAVLEFEQSSFEPLVVNKSYVAKHNPQVGGWFVVYEDGYQSWSPNDAFEKGYRLESEVKKEQEALNTRNLLPIHREFYSRQVNEQGVYRMDGIRRGFSALLDLLERACPPGREFSITRTKLEEACMFAIKAVSLDPGAAYGRGIPDAPAMFGEPGYPSSQPPLGNTEKDSRKPPSR